jgi:hypothetical protein
LEAWAYTRIDFIACDVPGERARLISIAQEIGGVSQTWWFPPTAYACWPPGYGAEKNFDLKRTWEKLARNMKSYNAHVHASMMDTRCATYDVWHWLALQGLNDRGHLWIMGTNMNIEVYEREYLQQGVWNLALSLYGEMSPYAFTRPMDGRIIVDAEPLDQAKFWNWFNKFDKDAIKNELLDEWFKKRLTDDNWDLKPGSSFWRGGFNQYAIFDSTWATLLAMNSALLAHGMSFTDSQLLSYLKKTDFYGLTGRVRFDAEGERIAKWSLQQIRTLHKGSDSCVDYHAAGIAIWPMPKFATDNPKYVPKGHILCSTTTTTPKARRLLDDQDEGRRLRTNHGETTAYSDDGGTPCTMMDEGQTSAVKDAKLIATYISCLKKTCTQWYIQG